MKSVPPSGKETVDALADHWGKLFAIYMLKNGHDEVVLGEKDIAALGRDEKMEKCIVVQELQDGLHIHLKTPQEAMAMARKNKGGFGKS